ncbi:MAG: ABC transporter [Chloroflexi bacterium]|nr:MAG: ABC transporter [Chloroflexota bacterium]
MTGDSGIVLSVEGLVKEYPGPPCRRALDGVTLDIPRGIFVALMGPSGSGKSTLLHLLGALDTPSAGRVYFEGQRVGDLSDDARTRLRRDRIGFVFQAFHLVDMLTVAENVSLGAAIRGDMRSRAGASAARNRTEQILADIGMPGRGQDYPDGLSGGEQQRVAIARALFTQPCVVIADEPTGNLDQSSGDAVLGMLRHAVDTRGCSAVMATHDPRAAAVADRVFLLRDGQICDHLQLGIEGRSRVDRIQAWLAAASA